MSRDTLRIWALAAAVISTTTLAAAAGTVELTTASAVPNLRVQAAASAQPGPVLVCGATGRTGSLLYEILKSRGVEVTRLVLPSCFGGSCMVLVGFAPVLIPE